MLHIIYGIEPGEYDSFIVIEGPAIDLDGEFRLWIESQIGPEPMPSMTYGKWTLQNGFIGQRRKTI